MEAVKLLEEIISDYPRIWEFYKQNTGERVRTMKYAQRYPLPLETISMAIDFHNWTFKTTDLVSSETGVELNSINRRTETGANPVVIYRLHWLSKTWNTLETRKKSLSKTLGSEVIDWHIRIRRIVNDGDFYQYLPSEVCDSCSNRSVMRMNDVFICITCRDAMTGQVKQWK